MFSLTPEHKRKISHNVVSIEPSLFPLGLHLLKGE